MKKKYSIEVATCGGVTRYYEYRIHQNGGHVICICHDQKEAQMIVDALNEKENRP